MSQLLLPVLVAWGLASGTAAASSGASREHGRRCLADPVHIIRAHTHPPEQARLSLTDCRGRPNPAALPQLSVLARPDGVDRPSRMRRDPEARFVARHIRRLHPALLKRLQALADRWPGRSIEIVSGYRPDARRTSRHYQARALDLRIRGVSDRAVRDVAKTLPHTGVGYYPNSVFVHVDVRENSFYWVDRSAPGERADYVARADLPDEGSRTPAARGRSRDREGDRDRGDPSVDRLVEDIYAEIERVTGERVLEALRENERVADRIRQSADEQEPEQKPSSADPADEPDDLQRISRRALIVSQGVEEEPLPPWMQRDLPSRDESGSQSSLRK